MLTDEQCNEFRRLPLSFNGMVRAIHAAGQKDMRERAAKVYERDDIWDGYDFQKAICNLGIE